MLAHKTSYEMADKKGKLPLHTLCASMAEHRNGMEFAEVCVHVGSAGTTMFPWMACKLLTVYSTARTAQAGRGMRIQHTSSPSRRHMGGCAASVANALATGGVANVSDAFMTGGQRCRLMREGQTFSGVTNVAANVSNTLATVRFSCVAL